MKIIGNVFNFPNFVVIERSFYDNFFSHSHCSYPLIFVLIPTFFYIYFGCSKNCLKKIVVQLTFPFYQIYSILRKKILKFQVQARKN